MSFIEFLKNWKGKIANWAKTQLAAAKLRDRMAMHALHGLIPLRQTQAHLADPTVLAAEAYRIADAMIEKRKN